MSSFFMHKEVPVLGGVFNFGKLEGFSRYDKVTGESSLPPLLFANLPDLVPSSACFCGV